MSTDLTDGRSMLCEELQNAAAWKNLMRLVTDAHGYADALAQSAADSSSPKDHAQLCKQLLSKCTALCETVATDWALGPEAIDASYLEAWRRQAGAIDATLCMVLAVGLFKARSVKRTRRTLAAALSELNSLVPIKPQAALAATVVTTTPTKPQKKRAKRVAKKVAIKRA